MASRTMTCTPASLIDTNPCLNCISEKELMAVLMYAFAHANDHTVAEALQNGACLTCLSKKQRLAAWVTIIANELLSDMTVPEIIEAIKCLECASDTQLQASLLAEACAYYNPSEQ